MDKVIFWDFDGTLVHPNERFVEAFKEALNKNGYVAPIERIREFLKTVYPWLNYDKSYENNTDKWWENFLDKLNEFYYEFKVKEDDREKINSEYKYKITKCNDYVLYDDTEYVLKKCLELGYKNFLLSNNYPELPDMLEDFGIKKYFTELFVSANVGYEKPRAELFSYAKTYAKCTSGIMVGDNPVADIDGAKATGLKAILVHKDRPSNADYTFKTLKEILDIL